VGVAAPNAIANFWSTSNANASREHPILASTTFASTVLISPNLIKQIEFNKVRGFSTKRREEKCIST